MSAVAAAGTEIYSRENAMYLIELLRDFFREKRQVQLSSLVPDAELIKYVEEMMPKIVAGQEASPLAVLNRRALSFLKDAIDRGAVTQPAPPPPEEDAFAKKLMDLEIARRNLGPPAPAAALAPAPAQAQQPQTVPVPAIAVPRTVVASAIAGTTSAIAIESSLRQWHQSFERSAITWSGEQRILPRLAELRTVALVLPAASVRDEPWISIQITGAGNAQESAYMLFDRSAGPWAFYKPAAEAKILRPLALPWNISLVGAMGHRLDLGKDGQAFKGASLRAGTYHRVMLFWVNESDAWMEFNAGDRVEVAIAIPSIKTLHSKTVYVNSTYIEIDLLAHSEPVDIQTIQNWSGILKNNHRQWTLFIESRA